MNKILPVVLSGGSGTRLWPLSREKYPKQLLPLIGKQSMLQATVTRLDGLDGLAEPLLVCNEEHRFVVAEQMRLLGKQGRVLLEPVGRNTAPALTLAALWARKQGGDPVLVVMPADHVILDEALFREAVARAVALAEAGRAVTFGITPDCPETGYGYIQQGAALAGDSGAYELARFVEKPDRQTAQAYLDAGDFLWNSGIFVMRASTWLTALELCRPDILAACRASLERGCEDGDFVRADPAAFAQCPADSIDYAVMERLTGSTAGLPKSAVIPLAAGWSDVGAWDALWKVLPKSEDGNAWRGDVLLEGCRDTLAIAENRLVACIGLRNMVVVETNDAVLVAHHEATQDVKKVVDRLKGEGRAVAQWHRKVYRPWGWYDGVDSGERFQVKRIGVKPGAALSLQMHHHRAEHWIVVSGTARVTKDDEVFLVSENQSTYIPLGVKHRLENPGIVPLEMIEVQSGSYLGEDDIVRFEDTYGRR
ncbi:mannose-1-phosphate guanylyltransferase/mannose-6-phosphate isomerase [Azonexus sp.]|jgi:mannose-1-phosphate guanylyltransferase/mannose-6-phosphate isomerase|uniref:mannose-1-phosphate guanylyltransferase/mannose-6-phosphate isomerase n=1 Tax=Azonexus sp. TaxID=1872668 RepID=UPI00282BA2D4|nr:mannose-1-phosphate guanylyltransferase/mannose-6-phosphate isomerase [Azonexus sp.]MDR1994292.1 mannose-1-phosphate guanylyltransferase/mannose-6-phosphate isomerase [Azonexus sp.]